MIIKLYLVKAGQVKKVSLEITEPVIFFYKFNVLLATKVVASYQVMFEISFHFAYVMIKTL